MRFPPNLSSCWSKNSHTSVWNWQNIPIRQYSVMFHNIIPSRNIWKIISAVDNSPCIIFSTNKYLIVKITVRCSISIYSLKHFSSSRIQYHYVGRLEEIDQFLVRRQLKVIVITRRGYILPCPDVGVVRIQLHKLSIEHRIVNCWRGYQDFVKYCVDSNWKVWRFYTLRVHWSSQEVENHYFHYAYAMKWLLS